MNRGIDFLYFQMRVLHMTKSMLILILGINTSDCYDAQDGFAKDVDTTYVKDNLAHSTNMKFEGTPLTIALPCALQN
jgi:hypothetical protein